MERTLFIPQIGKIEAKRSLFIPQIRKIEAERTLFIPQIGKIETKRSLFIPQIRKIEVELKKQYVHVCTNFKTLYLKKYASFLNQIFSESFYIHVLLAHRIWALYSFNVAKTPLSYWCWLSLSSKFFFLVHLKPWS